MKLTADKTQHSEAGFSLIELLVAFAIVTGTLVVVMQSVSLSAKHLQRDTEQRHALMVAKTLLAERRQLRSGGVQILEEGEIDGFNWTYHVTSLRQTADISIEFNPLQHRLLLESQSVPERQYEFVTFSMQTVR